jgi:diguanylate cyclase (GGDEF)-like protein
VVFAAIGAWFAVNYALVSSAIRLRFGDRWWPTVRLGLAYESLSTGSLLLLAPVLVAAARASAALIPLVLVPLFAVYRMARLSAEREQLAALDPLTGLPNRKALPTEVAEQVHLHAERAARGEPDAHLALLLLDLDRFKHVNDALGHAVGDRLLVEVSARLADVVGERDLLARLGGDEFAIVVPRLTGVDEARELADRVVAALAEPVPLDGLPLDVGGSIGIAIFPEHGEDFATLMRHADVAMYDAKHRNDTVAVYAAESDHNSAERLSLLADLRRVLESAPAGAVDEPPAGVRGGDGAALAPASGLTAPARADGVPGGGRAGVAFGAGRRWLRRRRERVAVGSDDELINRIVTGADPIRRRATRTPDGDGPATPAGPDRPTGVDRPAAEPRVGVRAGAAGGDAGEITMYYQPQIAIATGEVVGVEALLRWRHPRRGMVDPGELIQVAEQSAVMRLLTRRVVDDVVEQVAKWSAAGVKLRAALNVSVRDLHTGEIADQIADRLARYGVRPDRLQVEITEGALMADPRRVLASISQLHRIGVGIALDDFGTGYSSLLYLRRFPFNKLKIDRSFIRNIESAAEAAPIVHAIVSLGRGLGMKVTAEGVETAEQHLFLRAAGVHFMQGYRFSQPETAAAVEERLAEQAARGAMPPKVARAG